MNIAVFGGSFNPVHKGHYEIVRQIDQEMDFEKIYIVPAYKNPFKGQKPAIPESIRLAMLDSTFSEFKNVEISHYEIEKKETSYTINTIEHILSIHPNCRPYLILGADTYATFHLWTKADRIIELCQFLIFSRPALLLDESKTLKQTVNQEQVRHLKTKIPDISATEIRNSPLAITKQNKWLHLEAEKIWENYLSKNRSK